MAPKIVVSGDASAFFNESPFMMFPAILFRNTIYVSCPRHQDVLNLAFKNFSQHQLHRICNRVADGKETLLFGFAKGDGSEWTFDPRYQEARLAMYSLD